MSISVDDIKNLVTGIRTCDLTNDNQNAKNIFDHLTIEPVEIAVLAKTLKDYRISHLDSKSVVINDVRVFNDKSGNNISFDKYDAFARGIDYARGTLSVLQYSQLDNDNKANAVNSLTKLINSYKYELKQEDITPKEAVEQTQLFYKALSTLVNRYDITSNEKQAETAIRFMTDYLWQKDINNHPMCTVTKTEKDALRLQINEPLRFGKSVRDGDVNLSNARWSNLDNKLWSNLDTQNHKAPAWFKKLAKKAQGVGENKPKHPWLNNMMAAEVETLRTLPPTSITRFSPNPANAYHCHDVYVDNNNTIKHHSTHDKTAITEPLEVGNTKDLDDITAFNHKKMLETTLKTNINDYINRWGNLLDSNDAINFTALHQTLVADEVSGMPDQKKSKRGFGLVGALFGSNVIDSKVKANKAVRDYINKTNFYRHKETGEIIKFYKDDSFPERHGDIKDYQEVKITLAETNNCINMWEKGSRIRNRDINDAKHLIDNTKTLLSNLIIYKTANNDKELEAALKTVNKAFINSDYSFFTSHINYSTYEKDAIKLICDELKEHPEKFKGKKGDINSQVGHNLSLLIQSSAQLKRTVHETYLDAFTRVVSNSTRALRDKVPVLGHVIDWTVRGTLNLVSTAFKMVTEPFMWTAGAALGGLWNLITPASWAKVTLGGNLKHAFKGERTSHRKAMYEGTVAELQGQLFGGCMSSADRANEMSESRSALKLMHCETGDIMPFHANSSERQQYNDRLSTVHKHNAVEMAIGSPGTKDAETRGLSLLGSAGLAIENESKAELKLSATAAKIRHLKPKGQLTSQHMLDICSIKRDETENGTYDAKSTLNMLVGLNHSLENNKDSSLTKENSNPNQDNRGILESNVKNLDIIAELTEENQNEIETTPTLMKFN